MCQWLGTIPSDTLNLFHRLGLLCLAAGRLDVTFDTAKPTGCVDETTFIGGMAAITSVTSLSGTWMTEALLRWLPLLMLHLRSSAAALLLGRKRWHVLCLVNFAVKAVHGFFGHF